MLRFRLPFSLLAATAAGATGAALYTYNEQRHYRHHCGMPTVAGGVLPDLPSFTPAEVAEHASPSDAYVIYKDGVYDVSSFVDQHPGSARNIMMGAGSRIDPFWSTYRQHETDDVKALLEKYRIGNVAEEYRISKEERAASEALDPFESEPDRHPLLAVRSTQPFNAETPLELAAESWLTPNEFFYVRNHLPVPVIEDLADFRLVLSGVGVKELSLSLDDLRTKFRKHSVTATIQCAGNRRNEMNSVRPVRGGKWDAGAISNAEWSGALLRDVLLAAGIDEDNCDGQHVWFEGMDADITNVSYGASIPVRKALDRHGDVILAYEMNGEELPADHGYPLRVVAPGIAGARQVKWVNKITTSKFESPSHWQQHDYRSFGPNTDWHNVDWTSAPSIQDMPVQSAVCSIQELPNNQRLVKGYAWSGGGRSIIRVDVSHDGGENWVDAELTAGTMQEPDRAWAWTLWQATLPSDTGVVVCKATDSAYNGQPERVEPIWNLRGVLTNHWHRWK